MAELTEARVAHGERGFGDIALAGSEQAGGVLEAERAHIAIDRLADLGGKEPAQVCGAEPGGATRRPVSAGKAAN